MSAKDRERLYHYANGVGNPDTYQPKACDAPTTDGPCMLLAEHVGPHWNRSSPLDPEW